MQFKVYSSLELIDLSMKNEPYFIDLNVEDIHLKTKDPFEKT